MKPLILFFFLCVWTSPAPAAASDDASEAASSYMTAFLRGDAAKTTQLAHPKTKNAVKDSLVKSYQKMPTNDRAKLLEELKIKTESEFHQLSADWFFQWMIQTKANENLGFTNAMKDAKVAVVGFQTVNDTTIKVKLSMAAPGIATPQSAELIVSNHENRWLVER